MQFNGKNNEFLLLEEVNANNCILLKTPKESHLTLLWFLDDNTVLNIDGKTIKFKQHEMICLTEFHKLNVNHLGQVRMLQFNRAFYCIIDHDSEVGCKGMLFFGSAQLPFITLDKNNQETYQLLWQVFEKELQSKDNLQLEMLQMLLKRTLILTTRIYKEQQQLASWDKQQTNILREFNFLVETHFKTKHTVAEYAELLNKSPKTLSNIFAKLGSKPPLKYIQERKLLEAKRLLGYTDKSVSEIAYEIGYEDIQTFSRFFKKQEGVSPKEFKENK